MEVPSAITDIAIQNRALDLVVAQYQAFVDAAGGIAEYDVLTALAAGKITLSENIDVPVRIRFDPALSPADPAHNTGNGPAAGRDTFKTNNLRIK